MVRGSWVRYVRRFNPTPLGTTTDLQEFLFGSERSPLVSAVPVLTDLQQDECFYCSKRMKGEAVHVDHFIPWSRYPVDLGHNFVLAHARPCNLKKSDRLPAINHLNAWVQRNERYGKELAVALEARGMVQDLATSNQVARWAYSTLESANGLTWQRGDELTRLDPAWRTLLDKQ
jgi:hypothetical protein